MGRRKLVLTISHRRPRDYRCLNLFQSITKRCPILELNYFVFEKHVIKRTSKTNIRTLRLCACWRFKYASFYHRFQSFQSLFGSLFSIVLIAVWIDLNRLQNTGALELNYFVFETFCLLPFLASVSGRQCRFDFLYYSSTRHIILLQGILFLYKAYYSATRHIILLQGVLFCYKACKSWYNHPTWKYPFNSSTSQTNRIIWS